MRTMHSQKHSTHMEFALDLARAAGECIRSSFTLEMKKKWKADNSPITETDLLINEHVSNAVKEQFPDYSLLSEEGDVIVDGSSYTWVCDPVDGTIPFSHGIPLCVFSLALVYNGESILGVVYDPFMDRMFSSKKGEGAYLNGRKIKVCSTDSLDNSIVGIGYSKNARYDFSHLFNILKQRQVKTIDVYSRAYLGALVACGELTATVFPCTRPYDTAALKVIVEEAGGVVTDIFGNEQRYDGDINGHLMSNGFLHSELMNLVKSTVTPTQLSS